MKVPVSIELGPLDRAYLPQLRTWRNDYRVRKWTRQNDVLGETEHELWFQRQATDPTIKMYALLLTVGAVPQLIGVAGFTSIDRVNGRAEFSLYLGPEHHGKGLGTIALSVLFMHGFVNQGFNLIWGESFHGNPAIRIFEKLGMHRDGTRPEFYWRDGRYIDAHLYSITRASWIRLQQQPSQSSGSSDSSSSPASGSSPATFGAETSGGESMLQ